MGCCADTPGGGDCHIELYSRAEECWSRIWPFVVGRDALLGRRSQPLLDAYRVPHEAESVRRYLVSWSSLNLLSAVTPNTQHRREPRSSLSGRTERLWDTREGQSFLHRALRRITCFKGESGALARRAIRGQLQGGTVRRGQGDPAEEMPVEEDATVERRNVRPRLEPPHRALSNPRRWKQRAAALGRETEDHWEAGGECSGKMGPLPPAPQPAKTFTPQMRTTWMRVPSQREKWRRAPAPCPCASLSRAREATRKPETCSSSLDCMP